MKTFIQVNVENTAAFSYHRPLLPWLRAQVPEIAVLDIDSDSDEMLVLQAGRLLQEATFYAVYFKVAEPNARLGSAFKLVEEIIREDKPGLILIEGGHNRLTAIMQARPHLLLKTVTSQEEIKLHLAEYFKFTTHSG
jgi:hypothetical protein